MERAIISSDKIRNNLNKNTMKRVNDLLKYIESYSDIAVVNKRKIHQELLLIKEELGAINYSCCCKQLNKLKNIKL